jgi:transglutaminase-like putative cysteine protease
MDLIVRHTTTYHYPVPAQRISLLLRLKPADFDGQRTHFWDVSVNGAPVTDFTRNAMGDFEAHVQLQEQVRDLVIAAEGAVETQDRHGVVKGLQPELPAAVFLRSTPLTACDAAIAALAEGSEGVSMIEQLHSLSERVRGAVAYRSGATHSGSTAAEALALGRGVCQDHAHIFVSAARHLGVPARYVVGYFMADKAEDALHETHGWAEAHVEGLGWVGFDATNGMCTTDHYLRVCSGLDAHHAAPVRGAVFGAEQIGIDADVSIGEADKAQLEEAQQQQQQQQ